jgi:DNA-binding transcriptional ArsR family regulator
LLIYNWNKLGARGIKYKDMNLEKWPSLNKRVKLCGALSDPQRWLILEWLLKAEVPCAVGEIVKGLNLPDAAVSRHLQQLQQAGLVHRRRQGRFIYCQPRMKPLMELSAFIQKIIGQGEEKCVSPLLWPQAESLWDCEYRP